MKTSHRLSTSFMQRKQTTSLLTSVVDEVLMTYCVQQPAPRMRHVQSWKLNKATGEEMLLDITSFEKDMNG